MANIANFQQRCQTSLETISDIASISEEDVFSDVDALVRQECFQFQRMTTFIDHVNPELTPRWRDEVIWDKACPTYTDDNDNMLEYDTDDEAAPKYVTWKTHLFIDLAHRLSPPDRHHPSWSNGIANCPLANSLLRETKSEGMQCTPRTISCFVDRLQ